MYDEYDDLIDRPREKYPSFIKPGYRSFALPGPYEEAQRNLALNGWPSPKSGYYPKPIYNPNIRAVWEVATEVMYVNGWTGKKAANSASVESELVRLVLQRYRENGWMINPYQALSLRGAKLHVDPHESNDTWIDMALDPEKFVGGCLRSLFEAEPRVIKHRPRGFDPQDPDTWPAGMHVALDPSSRAYQTYVPLRHKASTYSSPIFNKEQLPWYQIALIPFAKAWAWYWSLQDAGKWFAVIIGALLFIALMIYLM